jgi:hypothetical protein
MMRSSNVDAKVCLVNKEMKGLTRGCCFTEEEAPFHRTHPRKVQMMSKHKDPKTVMRYDYERDNLDRNP